MDDTKLMVILAGLVVGSLCIAYTATRQRRHNKKPIYLMTGVLSFYFVALYIVASTDAGMASYLVRSGILTRIGQLALLGALALLLVSDWQRE
jgi:hypothetical protein